MRDTPRYSFGTFLKDRALFLAAAVLLLAFLTVVLSVLTVSLGGIVVIDLVVAVGALIYLALEYARDATFWRTLSESADSLEKSAYFIDLVEDPRTLKGKIAYSMAFAIANADAEELSALHQTLRANSEYIELWVHEAKTPLAAAKLVTKRMQGKDALILRRELERMGDLVEQALFSARMDTLDRDYLIREVNLADIAKEACKSHMHYLTSLDIALDFRIDPDLKVFADKIWLEFIITQIIINAAKYDAKTITFTATPPTQESSQASTVLEIRDNGCGIPAGDVPRVFDRGFTGEVGRAHGSATGMGLYLVACMCTSMGLSLMLASEEGVGTRVQIGFPHDRRRMRLTESGIPDTDQNQLPTSQNDQTPPNLTNA